MAIFIKIFIFLSENHEEIRLIYIANYLKDIKIIGRSGSVCY